VTRRPAVAAASVIATVIAAAPLLGAVA